MAPARPTTHLRPNRPPPSRRPCRRQPRAWNLNHPSRVRMQSNCAPGRIRTCDRWIRSPLLYPLSYERRQCGAGQHILSGRLILVVRLVPRRGRWPVASLATDTSQRGGLARRALLATTPGWWPARPRSSPGLASRPEHAAGSEPAVPVEASRCSRFRGATARFDMGCRLPRRLRTPAGWSSCAR
jgi:hypothetical protein